MVNGDALRNLNFPNYDKIDKAWAGLKKFFVCCHLTLGLLVGSVVQDFFYFDKGQSRSQGLTAF